MVPQAQIYVKILCFFVVFFFHYLLMISLACIYICDKDFNTVRKVSPGLYNVCIAMKLP